MGVYVASYSCSKCRRQWHPSDIKGNPSFIKCKGCNEIIKTNFTRTQPSDKWAIFAVLAGAGAVLAAIVFWLDFALQDAISFLVVGIVAGVVFFFVVWQQEKTQCGEDEIPKI